MTLFSLFSSLFSNRCDRGTGRGRHRSHTRLALEPLEDRQLLSTALPETSGAAPAIITFRDHVTNTYMPYIAWTGTDSQHHLNIENLSTKAKVTLPQTSSAAPALAVYKGRLFIAWTGTDPQHHLNIMSSADGLHFSYRTVLGQTTHALDGPVLAVHVNALAIAWTGIDLRLNYAYTFDIVGRYWGPANTLPYQSFFRPALDTFNGDFVISWTDFNNHYGSYSITYQKLLSNPYVLNLDAPSEATDDGFTGVSYLGIARTSLTTRNVSVYSDELGLIYVGKSPYGPSLAVDYLPDNHHFFVAWTGLDGHLYYDVL
jgi:hypothetical protein